MYVNENLLQCVALVSVFSFFYMLSIGIMVQHYLVAHAGLFQQQIKNIPFSVLQINK